MEKQLAQLDVESLKEFSPSGKPVSPIGRLEHMVFKHFWRLTGRKRSFKNMESLRDMSDMKKLT